MLLKGVLRTVQALWLICNTFWGNVVLANTPYYQILKVAELPNKPFTQGLDVYKGRLYFSSGLYHRSYIGFIDAAHHKSRYMPTNYFIEGIVNHDSELYALTWRAGKLLVLDSDTLKFKSKVNYKGQGWGLTHDNQYFIMSNGSSILQFRDSRYFKLIKNLWVNDKGQACKYLNDLSYSAGYIWANVWHSNQILKISKKTGQVVRRWDLSALVKQQGLKNSEAVLNGIAYDKRSNAFWITGKYWSKRFLVRFL